MAEVYMYMTNKYVKDALSCGLKLSEWSNLKYVIKDSEVNCIKAYLNPKDCPQYNKKRKIGLKLGVPNHKLFVAEGVFANKDKEENQNDYFIESILPINDYVFGMYRNPLCLITSTVDSNDVSVINENIDSPILYENSKEIYIENLFSGLKDENNNIVEECLLLWFEKQIKLGIMERVICKNEKVKIYKKNEDKLYIVKNNE